MICNSSMAVSHNAMSSASHDDIVMQCWRRETAVMAAPHNMMTYPVVRACARASAAGRDHLLDGDGCSRCSPYYCPGRFRSIQLRMAAEVASGRRFLIVRPTNLSYPGRACLLDSITARRVAALATLRLNVSRGPV